MCEPNTCSPSAATHSRAASPAPSRFPSTRAIRWRDLVERLVEKRAAFARAYGQDWREEKVLYVGAPDSATLADVAVFAAAGLGDAP